MQAVAKIAQFQPDTAFAERKRQIGKSGLSFGSCPPGAGIVRAGLTAARSVGHLGRWRAGLASFLLPCHPKAGGG